MMPDGFLAQAERLLAVPSTEDRPDELARALAQVLEIVGPGFTVQRFSSRGKPSALVHRGTAPPDGFGVILNAHLDVVPGEPGQFRPRRDGNRLYARGAHDMKVSALCQAHAFAEFAARSSYPVALQLVTDEEVGGRDGTEHQLRQGVTGRFVVIGEQSRLDVVTDSRGLAVVKLAATGRGAHGAYPWLGDNAVLKLTRTIDRLLARYPVPTAEAWRTTINVARIDTPNRAVNQVPATAEAWLDVRFTSEDTDLAGRDTAAVAGHLRGFCEPGVTVEVDHTDPPHHADRDRPEIALLRAAARAEGYPANFLRKHGAGDGRFYSRRGVPAVAFGIGGDGQHAQVEYADLDTVAPYHRALLAFLDAAAAA